MATDTVKEHNGIDPKAQPHACSAGTGGCCSCQDVIRQLSCGHEKADAVSIKDVLLVFFLPLLCALALVVWVVHSWPALAEHPGYLALAALAVACAALVLARILTRKNNHHPEDDHTQK